jgi:hypothetical protein
MTVNPEWLNLQKPGEQTRAHGARMQRAEAQRMMKAISCPSNTKRYASKRRIRSLIFFSLNWP